MDVFGRVLARLWASADFFGTESASPEANDDGFRAMGRHYGIASSLLDFTVDPRVAVAFADHSNHYDAGETGVVYALPIHEVMREFGESTVKGVLPFPFDRRIYRQRGIFLDLSDLEATDLMDHYVQIRFPITHSFEVRRFDEPIDLLGRDEWLSTLVDWTEDVVDGVAQVDAGDDMDELCLAFTREHGYPHWAKTSRASPHLFDVADNVEHLLYNLVYRYIPERNGEIPDPDLYAWLIRQNPAVFEAIAYLWISMVHQLNPMRMANAKAVIDLLPNGYDSDLHLNVETRLQQVADEFDIDLR